MGNVPAKSVLGHLWKDEKYEISTWTNWLIPNQKPNSWISVHYHPSYLERQQDDLLDLLFRKHLKRALSKTKRPWDTIPNYEDTIELIYQPKIVIKRIKHLMKKVKLIAFDFETNCIKPEYEGAKIVSCSVCWGDEHTIAFPWTKETADIVDELLLSPIKKIGSNIKFEERWTQYVFGHPVKNWDWDTMLASHTLNNNKGITGLKFQSFVRLGQPPYDKHIERYMRATRRQYLNQIEKLSLKDLLIYNGMDSLMEFKLSQIQRKEISNGSRRKMEA